MIAVALLIFSRTRWRTVTSAVPRNWDFPPPNNKAADHLIRKVKYQASLSLSFVPLISSQEKEAVHDFNAVQVDRI